MNQPTLVIMAAGMGSRYGGLKQMDPVDGIGHLIIDFSIYDALQAGFRKIVFIIKREIEADFKEVIGNRMAQVAEVSYVFQSLDNLPDGFTMPAGRVKPLGTGHAILSCLGTVDGAFAVINADDYYGRDAFCAIYNYLCTAKDDAQYRYAMVGYRLDNTLTKNGHVARGVCEVDANGNLTDIHERVRIEKTVEGAAYTEDDGTTWVPLAVDSTVSMNLWGFTGSILNELNEQFVAFLSEKLPKDPLKCEYFLPTVVNNLIQDGKATAMVLKSADKWYGVTYQEDKQVVVDAIQAMKQAKIYPEYLWK